MSCGVLLNVFRRLSLLNLDHFSQGFKGFYVHKESFLTI
nr:MAG TPA: hypothetical protein [Bacteriophage sp.]